MNTEPKPSDFFSEVKQLIILLRRNRNCTENWIAFKTLVETKPEKTCAELNTRWLVSVADTYADFGDEIEKRNALYISMLANFEKLALTRLLIYDLNLNNARLKLLKAHRIIPLWDGMYSFNINRGDMSMNLFHRIRRQLIETPFLSKVFEEVLQRILQNKTQLADLQQYHRNMFAKPRKHSITRSILRKFRYFFRDNRLL